MFKIVLFAVSISVILAFNKFVSVFIATPNAMIFSLFSPMLLNVIGKEFFLESNLFKTEFSL
jgi:hypothetical protein